MEIKRVFLFFGALALVFGVLYLLVSRVSAPTRQRPIRVGEVPPAIQLTDLQDVRYALSDFKGKVTLVNFWISSCMGCVEEMPSLHQAYLKLRDRGFEILAISLDEDEQIVRQFMDRWKLPFKVFLDREGVIASQYAIYGLPYSLILDRQGKTRHKIFGSRKWHEGEHLKLLEDLL